MRYVSPWTACILVAFSGFVTFALMNIVTAFFVETALVDAQEDLQKHMSSILWESFHHMDANHDREINEEEFMTNLHDPAMVAYLKKLELSPEKARDMHFFSLIDSPPDLVHDFRTPCGRARAPPRPPPHLRRGAPALSHTHICCRPMASLLVGY